MTKHSHIIGGSTAARLLNCPGSFQAIQALPAIVETPSEYAEYGSFCHAVMDHVFSMFTDGLPDQHLVVDVVHELVDAAIENPGNPQIFYDRPITAFDRDDAILPAIDHLYELMQIYGGGFSIGALELRVRFPNVPGAFGTTDMLLISKSHALLVDWKFGAGVPVKAVYKDEHGERVNPQLLFYFAGAMEELPSMFNKKRYAVAVIQPRTTERLTHTVITRTEIDMFIEDMDLAIIAALGKNPKLHAGEHCRWCPARPCCPEHTKPLFDLVNMEIMPAQLTASVVDDGNAAAYGEFLAKAKYLADLAADYKKQVDEALHSYLSNGGTVPGWKLKQKTKLRQWIDSDTVAFNLKRLGFEEEDIWQDKLQTFGHVDRVAKRLGVKIPDTLRAAPETDETVIAPESDPAPAIDRAKATEEFAAALRQLRHGG